MSAFGKMRSKTEGGPYDRDHELSDEVYEALYQRAEEINRLKRKLEADIRAAFEEARKLQQEIEPI